MTRRALLIGAALALLLGGCAAQRTVPGTAVAWGARQDALAALAHWDLRGRVAVKSADGGGQGDLRWRQWLDAASIRVSGPFGAGAYEIRWDPAEVVVTNRDGEVAAAYSGPDAADRFLAEQLGWEFPALSARFWVLGIPDPARPSRQRFGPDGWLAVIEQGGWRVQYDDFVERAGQWLPRKLTLTSGAARLRLVVDRWEPAAS